MSNTPISITGNVGALNNAKRGIWKVPSGYGGITVLGVNLVQSAVGTASVNLVNLGSSGTAVSGTIATGGTGLVAAVNVPDAFTVLAAGAFVDEGEWIGLEEKNVGALAAVSIVSVSAVAGK